MQLEVLHAGSFLELTLLEVPGINGENSAAENEEEVQTSRQ